MNGCSDPQEDKMSTIKWNPAYFADKMGFLSYSFMMDNQQCYSGMGWSHEQIKKLEILLGDNYCTLINGEAVEISKETLSNIQDTWHGLRYKKYNRVYVPRDANMEIVKTVYEAWEMRLPVMLEYEEGYEMYPSEEDEEDGACVSNNGLVHIAHIGRTTGSKPTLLHLASPCSYGGGEFMFKGTKSVKIVGLRGAA